MFNYYLFHYALPILSFANKTYNCIMNDVLYYYNTFTKSIQSNELIFFENNSNAYLSAYVNNLHKHSGLVVWRFDTYNNIFYSYNCALKDRKHFPILSASLLCESEKINCDDFFENLKVQASNPSFPTLQQVIEVYTYKSGIVFDRTKPWKLNILDTDVNEYTLDIFNDKWPFTKNTKN
jgi:hypothetical protein